MNNLFKERSLWWWIILLIILIIVCIMSKIDNLYQLSLMKDKKIEQNNTIHLTQKESNSSDKKRLNNQDQEKN